jgi:lipoate-protein ligase A
MQIANCKLDLGAAPCLLLVDPPRPGAWNMAVDEALLEWAALDGRRAWRFYRWSEPTLSLGFFQSFQNRLTHAASQNYPAVRRLTGGGAIVHDAELTYSMIVPAGHPFAAQRMALYELVHASLVEALDGFGLSATLCRGASRRSPNEEPFLCFLRRAPGDVLLGEAKIAGSAQRRRRGAVLQHGSLLLRRSEAAPELPGLEDLTGMSFAPDELAEAWLEKLTPRLDDGWQPGRLPESVKEQAAALSADRYRTQAWTIDRHDPIRVIAQC